jgi:hypothetical protein
MYQSYQKSKCIDQLNLKDNPNPRKSLMYLLSQDPSLSFFQHIRFYASKQDKYVPFASCLLEKEKSTTHPHINNNSNNSNNNNNTRAPTFKQSLPPIPSSSQMLQKTPDILYHEMLSHLNRTLENNFVEKFELCHFDTFSRDLLGRKSHISMVEDIHVLELILLSNRFHL